MYLLRIVRDMGKAFIDVLSGFYVFIGCDSISAFSGKGKKGVFRLMM